MLLLLKSPLTLARRFAGSLSRKLKRHKVVPDVIDHAPDEIVNVLYPNGDTVKLGNELTPSVVRCIPSVKWKAEKRALYFLCMIDPDAPDPKKPTQRFWNHWMVGNIPMNRLDKGNIVAEYIGSAPPKDTGLHRYVFLVYRQSAQLQFSGKRLLNNSAEGRGCLNLKKFAAMYNLGNPCFANFFQAKYDDYVPIAMAKLKPVC